MSSSPYPASTRTTGLPTNYFLTISLGAQDTTLTFARYYPERAYDVPISAQMQLKFFPLESKGERLIVNLPLMRSYHTTGGSLIVTARLTRETIHAFQDLERD